MYTFKQIVKNIENEIEWYETAIRGVNQDFSIVDMGMTEDEAIAFVNGMKNVISLFRIAERLTKE